MRRGLGPTRLMSPLRTFHSSGSSSRLVLRSLGPERVEPVVVGGAIGRIDRRLTHRPELDQGERLSSRDPVALV